jgi:hypothetical protein
MPPGSSIQEAQQDAASLRCAAKATGLCREGFDILAP